MATFVETATPGSALPAKLGALVASVKNLPNIYWQHQRDRSTVRPSTKCTMEASTWVRIPQIS